MKKAILVLFVAAVCNSVSAQIDIVTIAGTGTAGFSGDGSAATSATLSNPCGVAIDAAGNIYISDYSNNRIRKISTTGIISTIAGNGSAGYSGDGSAATSAQLNSPTKIAVDKAGNIYIADYNNNVIRKINTSGIISTFAGTGSSGYSGDGSAATSATLSRPSGVAIDKAGNVFIADYYNKVIRKVGTSGTISTYAGNGGGGFSGDGGPATSAQLGDPYGVAIDTAGNLYIADASNNRVRKVSASGTITTFAGNGTSGFGGDGAAATSANLKNPAGVATDRYGNVYIADQFNYRLRKVNASGIISTVAGNGTSGSGGDGGLATSAQLSLFNEVCVDSTGMFIYICDNGNNKVRFLNNCFTHITSQPQNDTVNKGNPGTFTIKDAGITATYQWQANMGSGFVNITGAPYSGYNSKTLTISSVTTAMSSYQYRCITSGGVCNDTSNNATLVVTTTGVSPLSIEDNITISPNPNSGYVTISSPVKIEKIEVMNMMGDLVFASQFNLEKVTINMSNLSSGAYLVRINNGSIKRVVKN